MFYIVGPKTEMIDEPFFFSFFQRTASFFGGQQGQFYPQMNDHAFLAGTYYLWLEVDK